MMPAQMMTVPAQLLAAEPPADPVALIYNGGVLGAVLLLFLAGKLATGREVDRLLAEIRARDELLARKDAELAALRVLYDERLERSATHAYELLTRLETRLIPAGPA